MSKVINTMAGAFFLLTLPCASADTNVSLNTGISYINQQNLQSSQAANSPGTTTSDRSGWLTGINGSWQTLNPSGGYSVSAQARLDQGLGDAGNIGSASLAGAWMHALSTTWLSRVNLLFSHYQDDDQPAYNNQTQGGKLTLGWFGSQNAGLDLNTGWQREQYDDNPNSPYHANRLTLGGRYYFAHPHNHPYWSISGQLGRFAAVQMPGYSYDSQRLSLDYHNWRWKKMQVNLQLQWRSNRFDGANSTMRMANMSDMGNAMDGSGSQRATQKDSYLTTALNLSYPLGKQWRINSRLNAGQYRSNLSENRPLLNAYLGISTSL